MNVNKYVSENLWIDKIEQSKPDIMETPHQHEAYEIFFLTQLEGPASIMIDGQDYPIKEGCVAIIDSNLPHQTFYHQATFRKRYLIEVNPSLLKNELSQLVGTSIPDFFHKYTGVHALDHHTLSQIENVLKIIYDETIFREKYYEDLVLLRILEIIVLLNRQYENNERTSKASDRQSQLVEPIMLYIVENIREELALESISKLFFIDKTYLARAFKAYTGQTVHSFINERKIESAKRYIALHPNAKTKEIAAYLSFKDTSYFCKLFKHHTGKTVHAFMKNEETF